MRSFPVVLAVGALALAGCGGSSSSGASAGSTSTPTTNAVNHAHSIVVMADNPNHILMGAHYHLYSSTNGGKTWHALTNQMVLSLAPVPAHPSTLFAVSLQKGLERSTDGGVHWTRLATNIPQGDITGVTMDPRNNALLAYGVGIYHSADGGAHWATELKKQSIYNIAVSGDGTAYASSSNGLFLSRDGGVHWSSVKAIGNQPVVQVAASGQVAYAIAAIALMKSTNDGRTWHALSKAPAGIEFMGVAPSNPSEIYGEIGAQGFVVSHNGGATWAKANSGITDRNFNASVIRVAPTAPNIVYTAAWGLHFYASHDGGQHWVRTATLLR
jgi:photosystem II stability/assembly factor-like uncharacterized protein